MKQRLRVLKSVVCTLGALSASAAWAQTASRDAASQPASLGAAVLSTLLFGLIGIVLAIVGFKLFDAATPFNLEREICEKQNLAVGILSAAIVLGICIIIAATVLS